MLGHFWLIYLVKSMISTVCSFVLMLIACGKFSTWICSSYCKAKAHLMPLTQCPLSKPISTNMWTWQITQSFDQNVSCDLYNQQIANWKQLQHIVSLSLSLFLSVLCVHEWINLNFHYSHFKIVSTWNRQHQRQQGINHSRRTDNDQHLILMAFLFVY